MNLSRFLQLDKQYSQKLRLQPEQKGWFGLMAVLAHSGDSWFWMTGLGLIWLFTREEWRARALVLGFGVVTLAVLVLAIKFTVRRRRPVGEWGAIYRNTDPHSFPSGHAARAFLLAVLGLGLGPGWFGVILALWAPLVSLARVVMGVHYLSDVLAGMVVGMAVGVLILPVRPVMELVLPFLF